jgi:hypothetical protein
MAERVSLFKSKVTANWDRMKEVIGRVVEKGSELIEAKDRPFIVVETERGDVRVYETEGLKDLFAAVVPGVFVNIEHLGMVQTSKGHQFRQFRSEAWTDPDAAPLKARPVDRQTRGRRAGKTK